ncbi:MAG: hypothetical protein CME80_08285 [Halomonas sp.]|nr:hypothetical protein [Halomonas sp.]MBF57701.1 hypothetical protein [Halomonas sp.]|tara:strand:- start:10623 stop:10832 length:210 start_codon:yes stop_codon:yes gene_type:complete
MANPVLDAAISALKQAANVQGAESIMTTDDHGNTLILLGADEPDRAGRLAGCMIRVEEEQAAKKGQAHG